MSARGCLAALAWLAAACAAAAQSHGGQGYGGLSERADGYASVSPGRGFDFPADHGPHPGYRIEWWYVTANLEGGDGTAYGIQWTLFRQALSPDPAADGWSAPQVWLAHAALTSADTHRTAEKLGRGGVGQAGVALGMALVAVQVLPQHEAVILPVVLGATVVFHGARGVDADGKMVARAIAAAGHEIASHGYEHELVGRLGPDGFRDSVRRSRSVLREISGQAGKAMV